MKLNTLLSDFIRAESGIESAVFDTRFTVVYAAVFNLLQSNNKTQWNIVTEACKMYSDIKQCVAALADAEGNNPATGKKLLASNAGVKKMHSVYCAYQSAIVTLPAFPAFARGRAVADIEAIASDCALQVATLVTGALQVAPKEPVTEAEKAVKAQAKADKEATAKAEVEQTIRTEAEKLANASVITLADMVRIVANALTQGMIDDDSYDVLAVACSDYTAQVEAAEMAHLLGAPVAVEQHA